MAGQPDRRSIEEIVELLKAGRTPENRPDAEPTVGSSLADDGTLSMFDEWISDFNNNVPIIDTSTYPGVVISDIPLPKEFIPKSPLDEKRQKYETLLGQYQLDSLDDFKRNDRNPYYEEQKPTRLIYDNRERYYDGRSPIKENESPYGSYGDNPLTYTSKLLEMLNRGQEYSNPFSETEVTADDIAAARAIKKAVDAAGVSVEVGVETGSKTLLGSGKPSSTVSSVEAVAERAGINANDEDGTKSDKSATPFTLPFQEGVGDLFAQDTAIVSRIGGVTLTNVTPEDIIAIARQLQSTGEYDGSGASADKFYGL